MADDDRVARERCQSFGQKRYEIVEAVGARELRRRAQIRRIDLPSDTREVSTRDREMARGGKKLRQQYQRPRELQRFGPLAFGRDSAKPGLHRKLGCATRLARRKRRASA